MTIAALPVTLVVLAAAVQAAKREIRWLMGVVMAFVMLGFAYFAFKVRLSFVFLIQARSTALKLNCGESYLFAALEDLGRR